MNNEILTPLEIQNAGFTHITHIAFSYNNFPCFALTYLLGEEKEWDIKLHDIEGVKQRAIDQMKKLGINWVYSVYIGDIFIPKDQTNGDRYHHIFARAAIKKD